ncbi:MAG: S1 RNA-binding domain-containing protein, partial [Acidobacteriota bacterium]
TGKVVRLEEYGAFVEIMPNLVGLLHISEVAPYRINDIRDVLKLGDTITVKVLSIDPVDNKIRLSKKALEQDGSSAPAEGSAPPPQRQHREHSGNRPHDRRNRY